MGSIENLQQDLSTRRSSRMVLLRIFSRIAQRSSRSGSIENLQQDLSTIESDDPLLKTIEFKRFFSKTGCFGKTPRNTGQVKLAFR